MVAGRLFHSDIFTTKNELVVVQKAGFSEKKALVGLVGVSNLWYNTAEMTPEISILIE